MKNADLWKPTKFDYRGSKIYASDNQEYVGLRSKIMIQCVAEAYQHVIEQHAHGVLLDLGCGFAPLYGLYKKYSSSVTLVDWGNSLHQNQFLDFEMDLNKKLMFENNQFDTVLLTDVLEHIYEPKQLLAEIYRILKPDGKLILGVPFLYWIHEQPHDYYRYTEFALKKMIEDENFKIEYIDAYGGSPELILDIFAKHLSKFPLMQSLFVKFATTLLRFSFVKNFSTKSKSRFPLGYVLVGRK